jgi:hypothetical protein
MTNAKVKNTATTAKNKRLGITARLDSYPINCGAIWIIWMKMQQVYSTGFMMQIKPGFWTSSTVSGKT